MYKIEDEEDIAETNLIENLKTKWWKKFLKKVNEWLLDNCDIVQKKPILK